MLKATFAVAVLVGSALFAMASPPDTCGGTSGWGGPCNVSNTGGSINIGGEMSSGGGDSGGGSGGDSGGDWGGSGGDSGDGDGGSGLVAVPCTTVLCRGGYAVGGPADPVVTGFPAVTAADLVGFTPASPSFGGQPEGVAVMGMPANFVAAASAHDVAGVLLGYNVTVRFTPVGFVFLYGDGQSRASSTGGATWESMGLGQFAPTDTSNTYAIRGTYTASVAVNYAAEVNFGTGVWFPVTGYVQADSGGYPVRVVSVSTALVDKTCVEEPEGLGCIP